MIPINPVLIHTIDMTASLAPMIFSMALGALVCGAVLAVGPVRTAFRVGAERAVLVLLAATGRAVRAPQ